MATEVAYALSLLTLQLHYPHSIQTGLVRLEQWRPSALRSLRLPLHGLWLGFLADEAAALEHTQPQKTKWISRSNTKAGWR
jgi:hypothetical protein